MVRINKGWFALTLLAILFISCGGGQRASVNVALSNYTDSCFVGAEGYKYDGFSVIPVVTVNNDTLDIGSYYYGPAYFEYYDEIPAIAQGSEVKVIIDYAEGKGEATDSMPGSFQITSPTSSFILHQGSDLNIEWDAAAGADQYWMTLNLSYDYIDNSGYYDYFYYELDTITEGTSITIPAATIFPSYVDTVYYGYGDVYVEATSGPKMEPGAKGNFKGDAVGFLWCSAVGPEVGFGVEQIIQQTHSLDIKKIVKRHQEILLKFAEEN